MLKLLEMLVQTTLLKETQWKAYVTFFWMGTETMKLLCHLGIALVM